ncbi:crotonobetainyl-CoA:carnitine CoA-transferase CaiB-like acyl-CoA transferase [Barrientosiimonas humi]|uniref:Crotonobetainyl-CoA:carnitine CoA-transferase CaiB-like acyl-CoA transferase n=1 Tax=Barrientosiimonas humi TaxID=999931 RepID=A0A542XFN3_9MICO|nr:CoA transferase [Barrientosiimonas humi]TQL34636.1 crotonobetainyl-CoA:carnitine CoA-transferase CaiB-like acyl-CoA transferase [Barrientosiimonas humi]CAG7574626.1 Acetyl-CoA:oxalate CoA-transferase [Barrientosiimonas humi]
MTGALEGLVVADFGRVLAAPYATMLMADLGAEVIKIERPGAGDDTRAWGPPFTDDGESTYFLSVNRNKSSRVLDLRTDEGRDAALALAAEADVVIENFLPGVMDRLGLGLDDVRAVNDDVIYCSVTGFGRDSQMPGYDLLVQAMSGLMSVTGPSPDEPTKVGVALLDIITGLHATTGILAALRHRDRTGEGQRVEVNLLSSALSALANQASAHLLTGVVPVATGNEHPSIAPYALYRTADRPVILAVGNDRQFASLATELGVLQLASDARFETNAARVAHAGELTAELERLLESDGADAWSQRLLAAGVPCGPVNTLPDAFALAERVGAPAVVEIDGVRQVANPIRLSATPADYRRRPPRLGEE